ncbi:hypothetical protein HK405_001915, partial [Cladochytrium tenue]
MVRSLDPNNPVMREALQPIITANFAELVKAYPSVTFHQASQRLSIGTPEGVCIVYDLKSATRVQILEGHQRSVSAVSFSADGRLIASYSAEENCVRLWQPSTSFLNTLAGALAAASGSGQTSGLGHMKSFREFSVGPPSAGAREARFEWASERSVRLVGCHDAPLVFT